MGWIKAYKGFDSNLQCQPDYRMRPFQYKVGEEYIEDEAQLCKKGFHACENPLEVFMYYPANFGRFCEVWLDATDEKKPGTSKRVGKKIKIEKELSAEELIEIGMKQALETAQETPSTISSIASEEDASVLTVKGISTIAASNVPDTTVVTGGPYSASIAIDARCAAINNGYQGVAVTGFSNGVSYCSGWSGLSAAIGAWSRATNTGDFGVAITTKASSTAIVTGEEGIAISLGPGGTAKGTVGTWLILSEFDYEFNDVRRKDVKCFYVDGKAIKENVEYTLVNGEPVEASKVWNSDSRE